MLNQAQPFGAPAAASIPDAAGIPDALDAPAPAQTLPAFTPVPREKSRSNGWNAQVQRQFIEALAETGSVRSACAHVGRADHGAYQLRRHPQADEFRRAWDAALDMGVRRIEDVAMDRALNGHEVPIYSYGELVGTRTVYNDRLLMFMLRARAPERFGGGLGRGSGARGDNAIDEMKLARLRKRWRQEWDDEAAAKRATASETTLAALDAKIGRIRDTWLADMSPRVRALYQAYQEAEREEEECGPPAPLPLLPGVHWRQESRCDCDDDEAEWEPVD